MTQLTGLFSRGSSYYLRVILPEDHPMALEYRSGKIVISLGCHSRRDAILRGRTKRAEILCNVWVRPSKSAGPNLGALRQEAQPILRGLRLQAMAGSSVIIGFLLRLWTTGSSARCAFWGRASVPADLSTSPEQKECFRIDSAGNIYGFKTVTTLEGQSVTFQADQFALAVPVADYAVLPTTWTPPLGDQFGFGYSS